MYVYYYSFDTIFYAINVWIAQNVVSFKSFLFIVSLVHNYLSLFITDVRSRISLLIHRINSVIHRFHKPCFHTSQW